MCSNTWNSNIPGIFMAINGPRRPMSPTNALAKALRRTMPTLLANSIVGVSPMTGPTGSVFSMRKRYGSKGLVGLTGTRPMQRRDVLRGRNNIRYHNNMLTQDRVYQMFSFDIDRDDDYYGEATKDSSYEFELQDEHYYAEDHQYELPLENVDELEGKLQKMINKYQSAIEHMGAMALLWSDLMDDLDANPHLQAQFDQFQMLRKLSGGTM